MSNLKRYTNFVDEFGKTIVLESQVGEFVKFDDVKELLQTATNKQSTPLQNCVSCGNDSCSMQAGVCAKWKPVE